MHPTEGYKSIEFRCRRRQGAGGFFEKDDNDGASPDAESDGRVVDRQHDP